MKDWVDGRDDSRRLFPTGRSLGNRLGGRAPDGRYQAAGTALQCFVAVARQHITNGRWLVWIVARPIESEAGRSKDADRRDKLGQCVSDDHVDTAIPERTGDKGSDGFAGKTTPPALRYDPVANLDDAILIRRTLVTRHANEPRP